MSTLLAYMLVDVAATFSVLGALTILRVAGPAAAGAGGAGGAAEDGRRRALSGLAAPHSSETRQFCLFVVLLTVGCAEKHTTRSVLATLRIGGV